MTRPIFWTTPALAQLTELYEYIAADSIPSAEKQVAAVLRGANSLINFPEMGRIGRRSGTRELVISRTQYIIAYRISDSVIDILAVLHGARRWPYKFTV